MPSVVHDDSQWPAGDQLGSGNLLTPAKRLEALVLVREGRLFDLVHVIEIGAPRFEPVQTPYLLLCAPNWQGGIRRRLAGATNDVVSPAATGRATMRSTEGVTSIPMPLPAR